MFKQSTDRFLLKISEFLSLHWDELLFKNHCQSDSLSPFPARLKQAVICWAFIFCLYSFLGSVNAVIAAGPLFAIPVVVSGFVLSRRISYAVAILAAIALTLNYKFVQTPQSGMLVFISVIPAALSYLILAEFTVAILKKLHELSLYKTLVKEIEFRKNSAAKISNIAINGKLQDRQLADYSNNMEE